ncbi:NCS2 family permease [Lactobacillus acetotolerans]|jgi:AGZA family xanthine/uracil permease-like MFS transporter|uniref:NCS2 family permease n=3 Tax=Lactobacillus acetotolerans TaxID=1600 RepID=A0A0D6A5C8_9LACO|nr:NCS2 family permease [Lactobacillus acetotolerans]QFG51946.1 NCS2 family permease [Lactobacillus acetotolerans]QGV05336.1 NCS2 family permease [Lactobacillus acetotolerans]QJD72865.1 NCS2 family permease [Lactobacillus acetotolerans]BAQ58032.1 xanthine-uracil permease [Lactobacillus acetotolerans]GGV10016.1 guanine permease [Lactobacillus acetotolerans DSM 20749 = JCM 3825]
MNFIKSYFRLDKYKTSVKVEFLAGLTTFISMSYILFVNPSVLGASGMNKGAVFTATALASALGTAIMGIVANYPIAEAPALGINAFFAYTVCIGMHVSWETALAAVFVASIIFILITMFKLREKIIDAIPADLKFAISSGIGLFIAFLGLQDSGLIVANKSTLVGLGSLHSPLVWISIFGLLVTIILMILNVPGAIFIGMILSAIFGICTGQIALPHKVISMAPSIAPTFGQAIFHVKDINTLQMWVVVLTFLLVTFFDTAGTLIGLAQQAGFMKNNKMPRVGKALASDSTAMMVGSVLGTSPVGAFVESSAGIAVGGRTGLTAVFVAIFFLISMIFSPLLSVFTTQVTAPALILVGVLMAQNTAHIHWNKLEIAVPSFLILIGMPLTYSISDGLALGLITYPICMVAAKRGKEVTPMMWILFVIFLIFLWVLNF